METEYIVLAPVMLQMVGLFLAVLIDPYIKKRDRRIMLAITGLVFSLVVQNYADYLSDQMGMDLLRTIVSVWGYSVRPVILLLFILPDLNRSGHGQCGSVFLCVFLADLFLDRRRSFPTRAFRIYLSCHQSYHAGLFLLSHHLRDTTCPEKGKHFSFAECDFHICRDRY